MATDLWNHLLMLFTHTHTYTYKHTHNSTEIVLNSIEN